MPTKQPARLERAAVHLHRRAAMALVARRFLRWCGAWWFLWGAMALALRTVWGTAGWSPWLGAVAMPVFLLLAFFRERRAIPSLAQCRAAVDSLTSSGGLLMAAGEGLATDSWRESMSRPLGAPVLRWRAGRLVALQAAGGAFLALCLLLPTPRLGVVPTPPPVLDLRAMLADYQAKIEVLAEEKVLDAQEEEKLTAMAKRLADGKSADDPESAWEALDQLGKAIDEKASDAAEQSLRNLANSEQAAELMRQLAQAVEDGKLTSDEAAAAAEELAKHFAEQPGAEALAEKLAALAQQGKLDPETMRQLAKAASKASTEAAEQLARMAEEGMLQEGAAGLPEAIAKQREQANAELSAFIAQQNAEGGEACAAIAVAAQAGTGGVSRGPGHRELSWTQGTNEEGASFRETVLPRGRQQDMKDSHLMGTDQTAPKALDTPLATSAGKLAGAAASGGSARTQSILPRHRRTVAEFFDRERSNGKGNAP